ncbi:MAG: hypothetical protein CO135_01920 [Candidatus Levybacteria bacterium CG_4_9_14_3_um_filter_35_16]|nr:MAG: hypothetical protein CO135_01920 [Candidatus Levybacteria bacterium CG_4_9_14_3_um_filter_35_16]PJC54236.1 MAG: hypothetical protein CO028_03400 [Candidatus Levybacteria bacterium CG_4_9_14_0_2_um_filter_35_21]
MENQENFFNKIKNFITNHPWYTLTSFIVTLIIVLLSLGSSKQSQRPGEQTRPSPSVMRFPTTIPIINQATNPYEDQIIEPFEQRSDFQKKELSIDGSMIYYFTSVNPNRPNITIVKGNDVLMERHVFEIEVNVSDYNNTYGKPERTLDNSTFYGTSFRVNIYGSRGLAFIEDKNNGNIVEQLTFRPQDAAVFVNNYLVFL